MCGLFGYAFSRQPGAAVVAMLAHQMDNRGGQAWGYLNALNGDTTKGLKRISKQVRRLGLLSHCMAHTRLATQGDNTVANAHPFAYEGPGGGISLAHNGQIWNGDKRFEVDSMELAYRVAMAKQFDDLQGYGVVTWYNRAFPKRIYLAQVSDSGSISVALTSMGVLYASTKKAVEEACEMAGLKIKQFYAVTTGVVHYLTQKGFYATELAPLKLAGLSTGREWERGNVITRSSDWDITNGEFARVYRPDPATGRMVRVASSKDLWEKHFAEKGEKVIELDGGAEEEIEVVEGELTATREEIEKDLQSVGYEADALSGLGMHELLDAWDKEYTGDNLPYNVTDNVDDEAYRD